MKRSKFNRVVLSLLIAGPLLGTPASSSEDPTASRDALRGRVTSGGGVPLEHAKVTVPATGAVTYTDHHGHFTLLDCPLPCRLVVAHPRFEEATVEVAEPPDAPLDVTLQAKQEVYERIDVTATRGGDDAFTPISVASTVITPEEQPTTPSTLTEILEGAPGVAENGQGGLFQVYAIRGVSRQRILTLVSEMQIIGERRAGVSTSFIDPLLIGSVDVLRGPSSTYYGSGALGGVVQVFPRTFDELAVETGWNSFGDENYQHLAWGDAASGWSLGFARRSAENDEAADGTPLDNRFTQYSASIRKEWGDDERSYELLLLPSYGEDIGKPNSDFPDDRITTYPRERHLLVKLDVADADGWSFHAFAHPNTLDTEVERIGQRFDTVANEAFDLGMSWQRRWSTEGRPGGSGGLSGRYGVDYFGRRGVTAFEQSRSLDGATLLSESLTLDDATQDEVAAYGTVSWGWGATTLQAGSRLTWHEQDNAGFESRDDSAWTGFLGVVRPLGSGFELTANVGTGLRFPSLSERFFTGTTGRGEVISNPDLDPERSLNTDLGIRWYGTKTFFGAQVFRLEVDDYIERIEVEDGVLTFVNLTSGTIEGFEVEGFYQPTDRWFYSWSGHLLDGEDDDGQPLADVSPHRLQLGVRYQRERWETQAQLQLRASKDDPGSGEMEIPSAQLLSASVSYRLNPELTLTVEGRNLLDEEYFNSADDKSVPSPGRSVGVRLGWSAGR